MLPNMSRQQKIDALQALTTGKKLAEVFPTKEVMVIEEGPQYWLWDYSMPAMNKQQLDSQIDRLKKDFKNFLLVIFRISKKEYDRISAKLEAEY